MVYPEPLKMLNRQSEFEMVTDGGESEQSKSELGSNTVTHPAPDDPQ